MQCTGPEGDKTVVIAISSQVGIGHPDGKVKTLYAHDLPTWRSMGTSAKLIPEHLWFVPYPLFTGLIKSLIAAGFSAKPR
jgi:hypothetical protein